MNIKKWHILVVENESDDIDLIYETLIHYGIHCTSAISLDEALRLVDTAVFTHIIVDLTFHGVNNWAVLESIQDAKFLVTLPCIAISAFHEPGLAKRVIEVGFGAYFVKPVDDIVLLYALQNMMED